MLLAHEPKQVVCLRSGGATSCFTNVFLFPGLISETHTCVSTYWPRGRGSFYRPFYLISPARRYASAGALCLRVTSPCSIETAERIKLFLARELAYLSYTVLKINLGMSKNKGTPLWNFCVNSAQSVINWTVVGHLSRQYLRAPTLDCFSLWRWPPSSVYSTIPSRKPISDSWYLYCRTVVW